ncbi:thiamine ABC transporter substrate binding subunit [Avibacterium sp. 21-599]|uniref:thiamine ABC transporter substrate binding subunit n=1 Tax=Avibacterium sp. 21-599 TaxID=2911528 RepID=UPI0022456C86|nr:thiamine ABC transporter substrate binding subunit [Avibacterium sp. 21-599]MCW9718064.1 thiamine ABC transporter substrate binding subunit [Avibacterium sp. 21-599]
MQFKKSFSLTFLTALFSTSLMATPSSAQEVQVYTYDSFSADWGAGPKVKALFEQTHPQCQVNYVPFDSTGVMFNRIRLEGKKSKADIVLGLDQTMLEEAKKTSLFAEHQVPMAQLSLPEKWEDKVFLPYDFGAYAFVYHKEKLPNPPKSLKELVDNQQLRIIYQDPRTSGVGRGLVILMNEVYGDDVEAAWKKLARHTVTVGKGWSETYGAFLKGESDLVFSYNTSPLYHLLNDKDANYAATDFAEGQVLQIETAARMANHPNACADAFMQFLITPEAQRQISQKNIMFAVIDEKIEPHFDALKQAQQSKTTLGSGVNTEQLKQWTNTWQASLTQ